METRRLTSRHLLSLALLVGLGIVGNYLRIPFSFGVDFLFGSIATMVIIRLFGTGWGVLSALLISSYTYLLWGHSLALTTFALEALVVGWLAQRWKGTSLLLLDGLFWVLLGMPIAWIIYPTILQFDPTGTAFVMLKQGVNGLFNALVAVLAVSHLPLNRWLLGEEERRRVPVGEALFNLLVAFLMLPTLVSTLLVSRHEVDRIHDEVDALLWSQSRQVVDDVGQWRTRNQRIVNALVRTVEEEGVTSSSQLGERLQNLLSSSPDLLRLSVLTADGRVVASSAQSQAFESVDTASLGEVKRRLQPVISDIHPSPVDPGLPLITISEPIMQNGTLIGVAQGLLDPRFPRQQVRAVPAPFPFHLTMLDRTGRVLASSRQDLRPLQPFDRSDGGQVSWNDQFRYLRSPGRATIALNRWRDSHEVLESPVPGDGGWRLVAEVSLAPYRARLYQIYIDNLLIILALTITALILSAALSRWVVRPLLQLTAITRYLPQRLQGGEAILWPSSPILEIDALSTDIRRMSTALREEFDEIEREARQQRALLSAAMEATDVAILITDEHGRIVYVNPPFLHEYGYTPDEVLGRRPGFLSGPTPDRRVPERILEAVRLGQPLAIDLVNYRKDGSPVDRELMLSPLRSPEGRVTHFVGIFRDISDRKALERMKGQFVRSLSHELHTPLSAIQGSLGLLSTQAAEGADPATRRLLQAATSHTERLLTLLTEILEYEGIESGQVEFHQQTLTASELAEPRVALARPKFEQAQVSLAAEVPPLPVLADPVRAGQALTYLLNHALESSKPGSQVRVTARAEPGEVLFAVQHQGPGLPPAPFDHLFQAIDQGRLSGTGLGLSIARAIIRQMEGRMWAESQKGHGSTLFFSLPTGPTIEEERAGGTLLLYATPEVADPAAQALRKAGFEVVPVHNTAAAWDALSGRAYDALLLDPNIPGSQGFLQDLRQSLRFVDLPVVLLSEPRDEVQLREMVRAACSQSA